MTDAEGRVRTVPSSTTWELPRGSGERWVDDYERGRPGWPAEVVVLADLPRAATVLDLGAGTGKLTRILASAFDRVIAVEPQVAMRRELTRRLPDVQALDGTGQEMPVADSSVDAAFVAQAFHRFDNSAALAEVARVLRPRGVLVLMWNFPVGPWEPTTAAAEELLLARAPGEDKLGVDPLDLRSRAYTSGEWRLAFTDSPFGELHEARLPNPQTLDRDGLVAYYASMGWIADLPDDERLPLLAGMSSLLDASQYRRQWETHAAVTRLE